MTRRDAMNAARLDTAEIAELRRATPAAPAPTAHFLTLQRTVGNAALARWVETLHADAEEVDAVPEELRQEGRGRFGVRAPITAGMIDILRPLATNPRTRSMRYAATSGTAFVRGERDAAPIDPNDVDQGALGDCWLMAALAAIAPANPELIRSMVSANGDGTYNVTLYVDGRGRLLVRGLHDPHVVRVDSSFPVDVQGETLYAGEGDVSPAEGPELWVMLIEKAYAITFGHGDMQALTGGGPASAMLGLTGVGTTYYERLEELSDDQVVTVLRTALHEHQAITVSTPEHFPPALVDLARQSGLAAKHAYASPASVSEPSICVTRTDFATCPDCPPQIFAG